MKYVHTFADRHGKQRTRFRRRGFSAYFRSAPDSPDFEAEYRAFMAGEKPSKASALPLPILSLVRQIPPSLDRCGEYVYFIEAENGLVKIGQTKSIRERFKKLQTGAAGQLTLLGITFGDQAFERELHVRFAADRATGEWFKASLELREFLENIGGTMSNPTPKVRHFQRGYGDPNGVANSFKNQRIIRLTGLSGTHCGHRGPEWNV